jgi:hypothetical protein
MHMSDRTPHEGGRRTPEDLLDALLAGNQGELLDNMTQALDTGAGLRALEPLRTGPPVKIEDRASQATAPRTQHPMAPPSSTEYEPVAIRDRREHTYLAVEMIRGLTEALEALQVNVDLPLAGGNACLECDLVLRRLALGLERRTLARGEAADLLTEAARKLLELQRSLSRSVDLGRKASKLVGVFVEELKRISVVVARMFDDAHDNISIEY